MELGVEINTPQVASDFATSTTMAHFPQQLIEEILARLPGKSLLRFQTVSKNWYSLISQVEFAKTHCKQSSPLNNQIFFQNHEDNALFYSSDIDTCSSRKISFSANKLVTPCCVVGSANGLICVAPMSKRYCYIWNPCLDTHKLIYVPYYGCNIYGFGYDSYSDDYKIFGSDSRGNFRIFSLRTNSSKIIEKRGISLCRDLPSFKAKAVLSNGALHWCAGPMQTKIIALDLATHKFFTIKRPQEIENCYYYWSWVPLFNYNGSLCICDGESIWVMNEYGVGKSWTKLGTYFASKIEKPVGITRAGKITFHRYDNQGRTNNWSHHFDIARVFGFTESLVSPDSPQLL